MKKGEAPRAEEFVSYDVILIVVREKMGDARDGKKWKMSESIRQLSRVIMICGSQCLLALTHL